MSSSLPVNTRVDCVGLPSLRFLCPIPLHSSQLPRHESSSPATQQQDADSAASTAAPSSSASRLERISAGDADVFLFSPESGSAAGSGAEAGLQWVRRERQLQSVRYVCGEMLQVEAVLINPLRVPLRVQSIQLQTEGVEFAAFPSHALLPPESEGVTLLLTGKAMAAGTLHIVGCLIRCFNLVSEHRVDRSGEGIQPQHVRRSAARILPATPCTTAAELSLSALSVMCAAAAVREERRDQARSASSGRVRDRHRAPHAAGQLQPPHPS
jgi:hypothetical protein